jgi:hypothetical protein
MDIDLSGGGGSGSGSGSGGFSPSRKNARVGYVGFRAIRSGQFVKVSQVRLGAPVSPLQSKVAEYRIWAPLSFHVKNEMYDYNCLSGLASTYGI